MDCRSYSIGKATYEETLGSISPALIVLLFVSVAARRRPIRARVNDGPAKQAILTSFTSPPTSRIRIMFYPQTVSLPSIRTAQPGSSTHVTQVVFTFSKSLFWRRSIRSGRLLSLSRA